MFEKYLKYVLNVWEFTWVRGLFYRFLFALEPNKVNGLFVILLYKCMKV